MTNNRSSDELIDKKIESKVLALYESSLKDMGELIYVCTDDELDYNTGSRVGMMLALYGDDINCHRVKVVIDFIADSLKLDKPDDLRWDDTDQIGWTQWTNDPGHGDNQAIVDWINKQIAEHKAG
jgi:hypothetical protein